jgi:hypothetical protein
MILRTSSPVNEPVCPFLEHLGFTVQGPSCQSARCFGDILFRVMPLPQREQFHDFARKIFVGIFLSTLRLVQPDQHRGILPHLDQQLWPVTQCESAKQLILAPDIIGLADFHGAGRKVTVPKQRHLFLQRTQPANHPPQPPAAQFQDALPLELLFLPLHLPALRFGGLTHRRQLTHPLRIRPGPGRIDRGIRDLVVIHQARYRRLRTQRYEFLDVLGGAAKSCAIDQMSRLDEIPLGRINRLEHIYEPDGRVRFQVSQPPDNA